MPGINKATILGNVGKDPEIRTLNSGDRMCSFSVATSETWRDKSSGEKKEKTEWHKITVWPQGLIDVIEKYVRKGDRIYVEGQIETRKWTDQSGQDRYSTEIVVKGFNGRIELLGERRGSSDRGEPDAYPDRAAAPRQRNRNDDLDDEIPF